MAREARRGIVQLRLYVAGDAPNSIRARENLRQLLAEHAHPDREVTIVDVFDRPDLAVLDRVFVTPMLVRISPPPVRRVIGNLTDRDAVMPLLVASSDEEEP